MGTPMAERSVSIPLNDAVLEATLTNADASSRGVVVFAHGSGSGRHSPRNRAVAHALARAGFSAVRADLLTIEEDFAERRGGRLRFDIELLAQRLRGITRWALAQAALRGLPLAYFGASTGAAVALVAAADEPEWVRALVSRGGRLDLAGARLARVRAPTLLIAGELDGAVIEMNREALTRLQTAKRLEIVARAGHLFEESGALETVARMALHWFDRHLTRSPRERRRAHAAPPPV